MPLRIAKLAFLLLVALPLSAATFRSHDGTTLHYDVIGKGEPVLLLSGGPGFSPDYLRPIAETLQAKRAFVLLHQRGTGKSQLAKIDMTTLALPKLVADIESLREHLGVAKLTIAGHSFGGILAMMYARTHPDRVKALALIDSGGPTLAGVSTFTKNLEARYTAEDRALIQEWSAPERIKADRAKAVLALTRAKTPAYFADRDKARPFIESLNERSVTDAVFHAVVPQMIMLDIREGLEKVKAPVLVIHGRQDPLESAAEVHATFPGSSLVMIEDAGHFPWLEQPKPFFEALAAFLAP
jgi:proline iminopeptidase